MMLFTSDWHLNGSALLDNKLRPFKSIEKMNKVLIDNANNKAKQADDLIIHAGDFIQYGDSAGAEGVKEHPRLFLEKINANMLLLAGNHDSSNNVKAYLDHLHVPAPRELRKLTGSWLSVSHYPSTCYTDPSNKYAGKIRGWQDWIRGVHLHGHCHEGVKGDYGRVYYDAKARVLNVNIACDLWRFTPIGINDIVREVQKYLKEHSKNL